MISVATPEGITVSEMKIGDTQITKTNKWGYSGGEITFKATYLSSLEDGVTLFTVLMSNGDTSTITITIGA